MSNYKKFLFYVILSTSLLVGGTVYSGSHKNESKKDSYSRIVDFSDNVEAKSAVQAAEALISTLPEFKDLNVEDEEIIFEAKQLIKEANMLNPALVISGEEKVKKFETELLRLINSQAKKEMQINKDKKDKEDQDKVDSEKEDDIVETVVTPSPTVQGSKPSTSKVKVTYSEKVDYQAIGFETDYINDSSLAKGSSKVKSDGINGQRTIITNIKYENGSEVSREVLSNNINKQPVNKVVLVGTYVEPPAVHSGQSGSMINEINASRSNNGLGSLYRNSRLDAAAQVRVNEIVASFSHTRPDGQPFYSVDSTVAGENIAYGNADSAITHGRFMNSAGHRENILRAEFKSVGVAVYKPADGPTYWVVLFGRN